MKEARRLQELYDEECAQELERRMLTLRRNRTEVICQTSLLEDKRERWVPLASSCEPTCWRWSKGHHHHHSGGLAPKLACSLATSGIKKRLLRLPILILLTLQKSVIEKFHSAEIGLRLEFLKQRSGRSESPLEKIRLEHSACDKDGCKIRRAHCDTADLCAHSHPTSNRPSIQDLEAAVFRSPHWCMILAPKGVFLFRATNNLALTFSNGTWKDKNQILNGWRLIGRHSERDAQRGALRSYVRAVSRNGPHFHIHYLPWTQLKDFELVGSFYRYPPLCNLRFCSCYC